VPSPPAGTMACPGGVTANVTRETIAAYPLLEAVGGALADVVAGLAAMSACRGKVL
jgi:hypothetical protein